MLSHFFVGGLAKVDIVAIGWSQKLQAAMPPTGCGSAMIELP